VPSRLVTLVVALGSTAAIACVAWGVQAAVLPAPAHAELVASRAAAWFFRYRLVESMFQVGRGRPVRATCTQTWFRHPGGLADRGAVLRTTGSGTVILLPHDLDVMSAARSEPRWLPRAQLELGGCPRLLGDQIARADESTTTPRLTAVDVLGRRLLALGVRATPLRLVVLLAPRSDRPVGLMVNGDGFRGTSTLRLTRVTPRLLSTRGLAK
jgi:hypothetical protein